MYRTLFKTLSNCNRNATRNIHVEKEPPYLSQLIPNIPEYPALNIQLKGYDFVVLQKFASWIHKTSQHMEITVADAWATPAEKMRVTRFHPDSTNIAEEYYLNIYERNIQVVELSSIKAPMLLRFIKMGLPEGVSLSVHEHLEEHEKIRYIPDLNLKQLKLDYDNVGLDKKRRK